jgi:hypothetical protein
MTVQGDHSSADFIGCCSLDNFVRAVARLWTAHLVADTRNTYSLDSMDCRCGDNNTAMGRLVA